MTRRLYASLLMVLCLHTYLYAQVQRIFDSSVRTLTLVVDDDPTLPPILSLAKRQGVEISWDQMSHDFHRYRYHIEHCNWDWTPSEGLFESDYLAGLNDQLVEDCEKSFNTTQIYTHYSLSLPNRETRFLLSGNYRVQVFDENDEENPVLEAQFCVYENTAGIRSEISSNTDIDFNGQHQQVSLAIDYGTLDVIDPSQDLHTVVMQNRRHDNCVSDLAPNIRSGKGIEFTHNKNLIFKAGSEFHHFEILDVHRTSTGVDRMDWIDPFYHASLFPDQPASNYSYTEDQNGVYVLRSADDTDDAFTAEYVVVHFTLQTPRLPGGDVYVCGQWTGQTLSPDCKMEYDEDNFEYHASILLKQGYYSYQYVQEDGSTARTMGDFYETENEYSIFVYFRGQGARYDRLAGYSRVKTS